jgi:hypothetical protein
LRIRFEFWFDGSRLTGLLSAPAIGSLWPFTADFVSGLNCK